MTITLPTVLTLPERDFSRYTWLIYGPPGAGKTTLANEFPQACFICTEEGTKNLSLFRPERNGKPLPFIVWKDVVEAFELLKKDTTFRYVVIDTIDFLYLACMAGVCERLKIDHPTDLEYGKGWSLLQNEFQKTLVSLIAYKGVIFISHAKEKDVTYRGTKITKITSTISDHARGMVHPVVDIIAYLGFKSRYNSTIRRMEAFREITIEPSETLEVKERTNGRLRGVFPYELGKGYTVLKEAFGKEK